MVNVLFSIIQVCFIVMERGVFFTFTYWISRILWCGFKRLCAF